MAYNLSDIERIVDFKTWTERKRIDELLRIDCNQYTNLGSDSSKKEREEVNRNSRKIYKAIKVIDKELGSKLLYAMDS